MQIDWQEVFSASLTLLPTIVTLFIVGLVLAVARVILFRNTKTSRTKPESLGRQVILIILGVLGFAALILSLPIAPEDRRQLLSLAGLLLSGAIALASASFLGNIMAGLMLRSVKNIRIGDYIFVEDIEGRVSERGLFRVEIQNESRDLISVPNMFLASHPVRVVQSTGTIIHSDVSLGYDVSRQHVESLLKDAASRSELIDSFVLIRRLDNHSVVYRISGILEDVTRRLSAMSKLNGNVLDVLHEAGIEIASPTIMNQRSLESEFRIIPPNPMPPESVSAQTDGSEENPADRLAFDKADAAALREKLASLETGLTGFLEELRQTGSDEAEIARVEQLLQGVIASRQTQEDETE